jgi:hypothetical protein
MANTERVREVVAGFSPEVVQRKIAEGWRLVALEWERGGAAQETMPPQVSAEVPFGLKVAGDCTRLEDSPAEREVLVAMMELTIQDGPYSGIAEELNRRGFRTREGMRWTPVSVFQMLPRLIEVGPKIFNTEEWQERRSRIAQMQPR